MIISRSMDCPNCGSDHHGMCYVTYENGSHCYSCGKGTRKSLEQFAFRPRELTSERKELFVPDNTLNVNEFSTRVLSWLYSYFVYDDLIRSSRIAYAPATEWHDESLLFPVSKLDTETQDVTNNGVLGNSQNNNIVEYQRRFFPKAFFSTSGVKQTVFVCGSQTTNTIVLVEDYISTIRVGQIAPSLCLFGTSLNNINLKYLLENYTNILIWLDNDAPGTTAAKKIETQLSRAFTHKMLQKPFIYQQIGNIWNINSQLQPKEYSDNQIKEILTNYEEPINVNRECIKGSINSYS